MPSLPYDTYGRQYSQASLFHTEPNLFEELTETKTAKNGNIQQTHKNLSMNMFLQGAAKKVIPCHILQIFKQPFKNFLMKLCNYILCSY